MSGMKKGVVRRVAYQAARYVEHVWPKLEKKGGVPDTPMNRKERGQSSPVIGEYGMDVIDANRGASKYLRFHIDYFETSATRATNGLYFSDILARVRYAPGNITNWRAGKTAEDKRMLEAFDELMVQIAKGVIFVFGEDTIEKALDAEEDDPKRFCVVVNPGDEQRRAQTREAQKIDTLYTRRLMVEQLEEVKEEFPHLGVMECMEILSDRKKREVPSKDWSVSKLLKAQKVVNKEREGEVA